MPRQAQRHQPPRPQDQAGFKTGLPGPNFGISAQTESVHGHGFDHGAVAANRCAFGVQPRPAILKHGDIGGGTANVGNHSIGQPGEMAGANKACRRAGQNGFDWPQQRLLGSNQGAVAAHDHQRRIDAALFEIAAGGIDQPRHHGDQPGVEQSGQGPARAAKPGRQVVAAGDRQCGAGANQIPCCDFMGRIAHREISGDRHCRDLLRQRRQPLFQQGQIERGFATVDIMSPGKMDHRIMPRASARPSRPRSSGEKPIITSAARPP
jgi:hypothetical protein